MTYSALILEADGRDFLGIAADSNTVTGIQIQDPPTSPVPMYGPPLSACTPFESLIAQEVMYQLVFFLFYFIVLYCSP